MRCRSDRIKAARELRMEEIADICAQIHLQVEVFAHGARCVADSGRCPLSSFLAGRDGNRGRCAQPCRRHYALADHLTARNR